MHYRARSLLAGNHYLTFASLYALFCSEFSAKGDLPVNSIFLCFCVALVYVHPGVEISIPLCMNIEGETHFNEKKLQLKSCSEQSLDLRQQRRSLISSSRFQSLLDTKCTSLLPLKYSTKSGKIFLIISIFHSQDPWLIKSDTYMSQSPFLRSPIGTTREELTCILCIQMMHSKFNIPPGHTRKDSPCHGSTESGMNPNTKESTILRFNHKYILVKKSLMHGTSQ
ncbi:unnamed protein product [Brassica rapa subsp. trilocularis]